jgi:SOS response regulatory protein OraA/RecX
MPPRAREKYDTEALWNYALRLLAGRSLTIAELKRKLTAKAAFEGDIAETLSKLKEMRVLNDRHYADSFATARRDGAGFGKQRVLRELAAKQVPKTVAETAVNEAYAGVDEVDHAVSFLQRKVRSTDFSDPKHLQSAFRKLRYNGFSSNAAIKALKQFSSRADEIDESDDE